MPAMSPASDTALTLNFVDGDHALLEQFLGFARHDPDRIVKLRTV